MVERTFTVLRTTKAPGKPPQVVTEVKTVTVPLERVRTVRRNGKTVLVTTPGETVINAVTVPGKDRVVTDTRTSTVMRTRDRFNTVTAPGATITTPGETINRTETRETTIAGPETTIAGPTRTVTNESTVTNERTVTNEQTVTGPTTTVTGPTVTVTGPTTTVTVMKMQTSLNTTDCARPLTFLSVSTADGFPFVRSDIRLVCLSIPPPPGGLTIRRFV